MPYSRQQVSVSHTEDNNIANVMRYTHCKCLLDTVVTWYKVGDVPQNFPLFTCQHSRIPHFLTPAFYPHVGTQTDKRRQ